MGLIATCFVCVSLTASASQATDTAEQKPDMVPVQGGNSREQIVTVTVKGRRARRRIDRDVYDNTKSPNFETGSAADVLRRVPSIAVDGKGTVYFRGRTNVQIYVDGQPSEMMGEDVRGMVLNAMPSNGISSVEVITMPDASLASGGGPIINLVTNRNLKPGGFGVLSVASDGADRDALSANGSYGGKTVTINAGVNIRNDSNGNTDMLRLQSLDPDGRTNSRTESWALQRNRSRSESVNGGVSIRPSQSNAFKFQFSDMEISSNGIGSIYRTTRNEAGLETSAYMANPVTTGEAALAAVSFNWTYTDLEAAETLKLDIRSSRNFSSNREVNVFSNGNPADLRQQMRVNATSSEVSTVSVDYDRPLGDATVKMGSSFTHAAANSTSIASGEGEAENDLLNSLYDSSQSVTAIYATYQRAIGEKWSVQGGVRGEHVFREARMEEARKWENRYFHWVPSLFALYQLSAEQKIRAAYRRDQQEPSLQALNPAVIYRDPQNVSRGNPDLKPQTTHTFEIEYESFSNGSSIQLKAFGSATRDVVLPVTRLIEDGIILRTQENGGAGSSLGIESSFARQITPKVNFQGGVGISRSTREGANFQKEAATSVNAQMNLGYYPNDKHSFMLLYTFQGEALSGQGRAKPSAFSALNYTRTYGMKYALSVDVENFIGSNDNLTTSRTPNLVTEFGSRMDRKRVMISFRHNFAKF